jgi:carbamoyltransferase
MYVLGFWDGHDAGAALLAGGEILVAVNEERLTRRKLEVGFPYRSIRACLEHAGLRPEEVGRVAVSTWDPAKTLTRLVPGLKEEYYLLRRRKKGPGLFYEAKKSFKYRFTEQPPGLLSRALSLRYLRGRLRELGFQGVPLDLVDHHAGHARAAAWCSGFEACAVLTLDGVGDGLSGSVWRFRQGDLALVRRIPARVSLGIFFEHVTHLLNMRELEDEGKVMALADFARPVEDRDNPMFGLIRTRGLEVVSEFSASGMVRELRKILWRYPSEQFAFMAQRVLESCVTELAVEVCRATGQGKIALAGGVFSNIKVNSKIAEQEPVEDAYVFPHMGDGGLALGAAVEATARAGGGSHGCRSADLYLGPEYSREEIRACLERRPGLAASLPDNLAERAAERILAGEIVFWFQGRMEYGPRALGNRSILARPDDPDIRDRLNRVLKMRVWYQPFCPSLLMEDAVCMLDHGGRGDLETNRFMTTGYRVMPEYRGLMQGVTSRDGTCRPHLVKGENPRFRALLEEVRKGLGRGVVLNTSFNTHGEPMVCSPDEALDMFETREIGCLALGDFWVQKR